MAHLAADTRATWWRAVATRDPAFDGAFVFADVLTGVYCRPSCPRRRPHRRHTLLFATGAEARAAHHRPCPRCRPDDERPAGEDDDEREALVLACRLLAHGCSRADVRARLGWSDDRVYRVFKRRLGIGPHRWARGQRAVART